MMWLNFIFLITGGYCLISGTREFNHAHKMVELLRGLFWLIIGAFVFIEALMRILGY
jgi:hypothetical protein